MHDDVTDRIAWKFARQLGRAGNAIAPPGSARRGACALAGRGLKALPRLRNRRYLAHKIKMSLIRTRGTLALALRPYQIISRRSAGAHGPSAKSIGLWACLSSPATIEWISRSSSRSSTTVDDTRDCLVSIARSTAGLCL